jgi:hypothetical protein
MYIDSDLNWYVCPECGDWEEREGIDINIILVGAGNLSRADIEQLNTTTDTCLFVGYALWSLITNEILELRPNFNIIDIHTLHTRKPEYVEWLKSLPNKKLMQEAYPDIQGSFSFPLNAIIDRYNSRYFISSFGYMIAYSMLINYKSITFLGVNMIDIGWGDDLIQKANFEYWLGKAETAQGIKIIMNDYNGLYTGKSLLYGYEADNTIGVEMSKYMNELYSNLERGINDCLRNLELMHSSFHRITRQRQQFVEEIERRHKENKNG